MGVVVTNSEYEGHAMIVVTAEGETRGAQMGKKKAGLFVGALAEVSAWVDNNAGGNGDLEMEVKNPAYPGPSKYPFNLKLSAARLYVQAVAEISAFAAE